MNDNTWRHVKRLRIPLPGNEIREEAAGRKSHGESSFDQYMALPSDFLREQIDREIKALNDESQASTSHMEWALLGVHIESNRLLLFLVGTLESPSHPYTYNYGHPYYNPFSYYQPAPPTTPWNDRAAYVPPSWPPYPSPTHRSGYSSNTSTDEKVFLPRRDPHERSSFAYKPTSTISHRYPVSSRQQDSGALPYSLPTFAVPHSTQPQASNSGPPPASSRMSPAAEVSERRDAERVSRQEAIMKEAEQAARNKGGSKLRATEASRREKDKDIQFKDCIGRYSLLLFTVATSS